MPLTDRKIATAKPQDRAYKLSDGEGLYVHVTPTGSKLWRMKYRFEGKEKVLSFGPYPAKSLKSARADRDAAREHVAEGRDPSAVKKATDAERARLNERNFAALVTLYLDKQRAEGRSASTLKKNEWLLGMAVADFGNAPVCDIKAPLILNTLKR